MKKLILLSAFFGLLVVITIGTLSQKDYETTELMKLKEKYSKTEKAAVDHSRFKILQQQFSSPQEITKVCVSCHNKTTQQVMNGHCCCRTWL